MKEIIVLILAYILLTVELGGQNKNDAYPVDEIQNKFNYHLRYSGQVKAFIPLYKQYPEVGQKLLLERSKHSNADIRKFAIHYISYTNDSVFVPTLLSLAEFDKNLQVKQRAIRALGNIEALQSAKKLSELLLKETNERSQRYMLGSLKKLASIEAVEPINAYIDKLKDKKVDDGLIDQAESILLLIQRYWGGDESKKQLIFEALSARTNSENFNWARNEISRNPDRSLLPILRVCVKNHLDDHHLEEAAFLIHLRSALNDKSFSEEEKRILQTTKNR